MLWEDKVEAWKELEVTIAFFAELKKDLEGLKESLVKESSYETILRIQGIARATLAIIELPDRDGIPNPEEGD